MNIRSVTIAVVAALVWAAAARGADVKIVVNSANVIESLTRDKTADIFLKKLTRWDNGKAVVPVDQSDKNAARDAFSRKFLKKEVPWVESYWQQMIFSGRATPPAKLTTEDEVLEFVRTHPDAVGYVSESVVLPAGVKAIAVKE